jgi:alpha-tubulin suppressor-like RCC1 family protein
VAGDERFTAVSASLESYTCGITAGASYCWGANAFGELGDGTTILRKSPAPVTGNPRFTAISAGGFHACGVTTTGDAYCWGNNNDGQLGDGTTTERTRPVLVRPIPTGSPR